MIGAAAGTNRERTGTPSVKGMTDDEVLAPVRTAKFRRRYRRSLAWHRVKHALGIRCRECV